MKDWKRSSRDASVFYHIRVLIHVLQIVQWSREVTAYFETAHLILFFAHLKGNSCQTTGLLGTHS